MVVEGMGHDLPRAAWPRLIDADRRARAAGRCRPRLSACPYRPAPRSEPVEEQEPTPPSPPGSPQRPCGRRL